MGKIFTVLLLLSASLPTAGQDTVRLSALPTNDRFPLWQHTGCFVDSTGKLSLKSLPRQRFSAVTDVAGFVQLHQQAATVWVRWLLLNDGNTPQETGFVCHRNFFSPLFVFQNDSLWFVKQPPAFFTGVTKNERKSFGLTLRPRALVAVYAKAGDKWMDVYRKYPVLTHAGVWPELIKDELYERRYYVFVDVFFLAIIFFIAIHTLVQYLFNRRKEFLLYVFYAATVLTYFLFKLDDYPYTDLSFAYAPHLHKYGNDILSYLLYFGYYRFVRQFIDFKKMAPPFYRVIRITEALLLLSVAVDLTAILAGWFSFRYLFFNLIRCYLVVVGFTGVTLLFRSQNKLAYFIATGSGFLLAGGLTSMIIGWLHGPPYAGFDPIVFYQGGMVMELLCFTLGLSYKTSLIEKEKIKTQQLLIGQLEENRKLQNELTYRLETRVQEQTAEILRKQDELEKEKEQQLMLAFRKKLAEMELQVLKSQLNPHFYFNTLNNLYGLTLINPSKAPDAILKLSDIMEYVIYDCKQEKVPLEKELKFISSYVELEKLRYDDGTQIELKVNGSSEGKLISPLLLIQFVENAFKHGIEETKQDSFLNVTIGINGRHLTYRSANSINGRPHNENGIGLANVRKRLGILYPGRHWLKIDEGKDFVVELELELEG